MLKAGFYEKIITPPLGGHIPGFFVPRVANDVLADLYARAAVIENGKEKVAFLTLDICGFYAERITPGIIKRITEFTDIKAENILICATHIHTGAPLNNDTFLRSDEPYIDMMIRLAADSVTLASLRMKEVTAKYACGKVDSISYVRNYKMKGGYVMTNPDRGNPDIIEPCTDIDPDVPVLCFYDKADRPCGAIISFACHQDCLWGDKCEYSTDFAGVMDKELKHVYGSEFVSVFFEGTCGNINHHNVHAEKPITLEHHRKMGRVLANEVISVLADADYIEGEEIVVMKDEITLNRRLFTDEDVENAKKFLKECEGKEIVYTEFNPQSEFMRYHYAHRTLAYMKDTSATHTVALMAIRIGNFILTAFPGEIFVQFGKMVKERSPYENKMVVTLAFESCGYVPTKDLFQPTVYESTLPTCIFEPDAGHLMTDKLCEMADKLANQ